MIDVSFTMPQEPEKFEVHVFADWHIGDPLSDERLIRKWITTVQERENAFCILNGDMLNTALKTSVSDSYKETMTPMKQLDYFLKLIDPIKKKIMFVDAGNHERRITKDTSIDLMEIVAREIGAPYCEEGAVIYISCGQNVEEHKEARIPYILYVTHGSGGGRTEGGKANALAQLMSVVDADIYVHSHVHLPGAFKEKYFRTDSRTRKTTHVTKLFVSTASPMDYGGYAQIAKYKPAATDNPVIILEGRRKKADAIV